MSQAATNPAPCLRRLRLKRRMFESQIATDSGLSWLADFGGGGVKVQKVRADVGQKELDALLIGLARRPNLLTLPDAAGKHTNVGCRLTITRPDLSHPRRSVVDYR